uniref:Uncharacterized protein n=1 Tax=Plectus sambesii TaxID=2011161 RepID=A0A914W864_9BILA
MDLGCVAVVKHRNVLPAGGGRSETPLAPPALSLAAAAALRCHRYLFMSERTNAGPTDGNIADATAASSPRSARNRRCPSRITTIYPLVQMPTHIIGKDDSGRAGNMPVDLRAAACNCRPFVSGKPLCPPAHRQSLRADDAGSARQTF